MRARTGKLGAPGTGEITAFSRRREHGPPLVPLPYAVRLSSVSVCGVFFFFENFFFFHVFSRRRFVRVWLGFILFVLKILFVSSTYAEK